MRRILAILPVAAILFGLCACTPATGGSTGATDTTVTDTTSGQSAFMAGFGEANITPDFAVELVGYGNESTRKSTGIQNYLYAYVLAVRDADGNTALMIGSDLMNIASSYTTALAQWCEANVGVSAENVIFSAAHQHSTPRMKGDYQEFATKLIHKAIEDAIADLAPAEMYINSVETEALNFVRHYWNAEGNIYTPNHGEIGGGLVKHESDADNEMQLLKFKRGEEKKDIIVINFQTHPYMSTSSQKTNISSDWVGVLRDKVAKELDCNVLYFSGAGGNLEDTSQIKSENKSDDYKEHGNRAASYVIEAEDSYTQVNTGAVKVKKVTITYQADHSMDHLAEEAAPIHDEFAKGNIEKARQLLEGHPNLFSVHHAYAIVEKAKAGPTKDMTISAISIGDVAFTAHPYEMFDTNGMELKNGTVGNENYTAEEQLENPYKMTIIATIANGYDSYIPSRMGYTNGGYSTDTAYYAPGTGERIVGDFLQILNELHGG